MTSMPGPPAPPAPPAPATGSAPPRRRSALPWVLVAILTVVAVVLGALLVFRPGGASGSGEQQGFVTPEEAIEVSTEHLAEGDAAAALAAWAGDAQAENLDLVGTLERLRAFSPADTASLPADDPFFVELAQTARAGTAAEQYRRLALSLLLPEVELDTTTTLGGDVSAQDIADALDSSRLTGLRAERIDRVEGPERFAETLAEAAALVGADERREYVVLYEWDGETYLGGVGVLRYGDDWQIDSLTSTLAGTSPGALEPMSAADYEDLLTDLSEG